MCFCVLFAFIISQTHGHVGKLTLSVLKNIYLPLITSFLHTEIAQETNSSPLDKMAAIL